MSCEIKPVRNVTLGLHCVTAGSPVTDAQWKKDNITILPTKIHEKYQTLLHGVTATYAHMIQLRGLPVDLEGAYTFTALNSHNESVTQTLHISGIWE